MKQFNILARKKEDIDGLSVPGTGGFSRGEWEGGHLRQVDGFRVRRRKEESIFNALERDRDIRKSHLFLPFNIYWYCLHGLRYSTGFHSAYRNNTEHTSPSSSSSMVFTSFFYFFSSLRLTQGRGSDVILIGVNMCVLICVMI